MGVSDQFDRNDRYDRSEISNLPEEAANPWSEIFDPQDHWLGSADKEDQLTAIRGWFYARYCDPVHETPYNGREGGYQFIHGGPFDPEDVLTERFSGIVDDETIQEVIDEMIDEVGEQWAPIRIDPPDDYDYDDRYELGLTSRNEPLQKLREKLTQAQNVLTLQGDDGARALAEKLVFGAVIGAFEAFLWETMDYWVENDDRAVHDIVTKIQHFREQSIKISEIYEKFAGLKKQVKGYLQNLVWHRWESVAPLFTLGLGLGKSMPSFKPFDDALVKRHDIVHRMGHDKDGIAISVTAVEISFLIAKIESFALEVDNLLNSRIIRQWRTDDSF